jgi:hypothetical protein
MNCLTREKKPPRGPLGSSAAANADWVRITLNNSAGMARFNTLKTLRIDPPPSPVSGSIFVEGAHLYLIG